MRTVPGPFYLNGGSYSDNTWRTFTLDVDALAASAGLSLTSTFVIKFQQYDNWPAIKDGDGREFVRRCNITLPVE